MCTSRSRGGFTLLEMVISMIFIVAIIQAMAMIYETLVREDMRVERMDLRGLYALEDDIIYSSALSKSISFDGSTLRITRYDGCTIEYVHDADKDEIKKRASCPDGVTEKALVVANVKTFDVSDEGDGLYSILVERGGSPFKFTFQIRRLQ